MLPIQTRHYIKGLDPVANAFAGTVTSDIVSLANWSNCTFIVFCGVGATGTSTITVEACDDTSGTNTSAVPFTYREILTGDTPGTLTKATSSGFTTTAGSSRIVVVSIESQALAASGYKYVRLKAVEVVASAVLGGILVELGGPRLASEPNASAIV
jgi:hypothetical protein